MNSSRFSFLLVVGLVLATVASAEPLKLQEGSDARRLYSLNAREAQHQALAGLTSVDVKYDGKGRVRQLDGKSGIRIAAMTELKQGDDAKVLYQRFRPVLLATGRESLRVRSTGAMPLERRFLLTDQEIDGVPVLDAGVNFVFDSQGEVIMIRSRFVPQGAARSIPELSAKEARAKLLESLLRAYQSRDATVDVDATGSLAYWTDEGKEDVPVLLWMFEVSVRAKEQSENVTYGVDGKTGDIRYSKQSTFALNRTVYSNGYRTQLSISSSNLLWTEGAVPSPADPQALSIYNLVVHPIQAWVSTPFHFDSLNLSASVSGLHICVSVMSAPGRLRLSFVRRILPERPLTTV